LNGSITTGVLFFLVGNIFAWFQFNSQFVWDWWKDKALLSNLLFAIPMGLCFWHAIRNIVLSTNQLWSSKLIGFGVGNVVFGILTYAFLKESVFTPKTLICLFLASLIIAIQIFWE
tara:strand:- start:621 stop:968 length:348 start_codon:yes stop_codon:yes gene_type:complete